MASPQRQGRRGRGSEPDDRRIRRVRAQGSAARKRIAVIFLGIGLLANSLTLGCDCLGHIRYFDAHMTDSAGRTGARGIARAARGAVRMA